MNRAERWEAVADRLAIALGFETGEHDVIPDGTPYAEENLYDAALAAYRAEKEKP